MNVLILLTPFGLFVNINDDIYIGNASWNYGKPIWNESFSKQAPPTNLSVLGAMQGEMIQSPMCKCGGVSYVCLSVFSIVLLQVKNIVHNFSCDNQRREKILLFFAAQIREAMLCLNWILYSLIIRFVYIH